jgi:hypothetical protein
MLGANRQMKLKNVLFLEYGIIALLTIAAIFNTTLALFDILGLIGLIFTALSFVFLPGHIVAMIITNTADSPALWSIIACYTIQGSIIAIVARRITLLLARARERS